MRIADAEPAGLWVLDEKWEAISETMVLHMLEDHWKRQHSQFLRRFIQHKRLNENFRVYLELREGHVCE